MEQLIGAQAKDVDDLRVERSIGRLAKCDDQVIEAAAPALNAGGDLGGERAVAFVVQSVRATAAMAVGRSARPVETRRRISYAATRAGAIMVAAGRRTGRPAASGWPARNSRAAIGRLPFGLQLERCAAVPAPVATTQVGRRAPRATVPGGSRRQLRRADTARPRAGSAAGRRET